MSIKNLTRSVQSITDNRHEYNLLRFYYDDIWKEETFIYNPSKNYFKKGKNFKKRTIFTWQVRMYKTWKHNRLHQHK